jgi:hypothetical protein
MTLPPTGIAEPEAGTQAPRGQPPVEEPGPIATLVHPATVPPPAAGPGTGLGRIAVGVSRPTVRIDGSSTGPFAAIGGFVSTAATQVGAFIRPDAALAVAGEFGFPLALAIAVLVYLLVQHHLDRRDPKLRIAPQHTGETLIGFDSEEQL